MHLLYAILYSTQHSTTELDPLKSFTVYQNTHIFGLSVGLVCVPVVGGRGYSTKLCTGDSGQKSCDYRRPETRSGGQVQYSMMYYLMILDD